MTSDFYGVRKLIDANGGVENFRCFAQMGRIEIVSPFGFGFVSGDRETWTECRVDESRYPLDDRYKITLRSVEPGFSYDHFYQGDFMSMVKEGFIKIKTCEGQKVEHVRWAEPLCGKAVLVHEADIVA